MDPSPSRALRKSKLPDFAPPRLVSLPNLARFLENLRMTISTYRPFEAKPVQPDSFALTSYIGRIEFQLIWKSWRPNLSPRFFSAVSGRVKSGIPLPGQGPSPPPPLPDPRFCQIWPALPENLRMAISTHRPFEAKPVQPDSLVLTSYFERIEYQLI